MIYEWVGRIWIAFWVIWILAAVTAKRTVRHQSAGTRFLHVVFIFLVYMFLFPGNFPLGPLDRRLWPAGLWTEDFGIALTLTGIAFAFWARAALGRNWSGSVTIKENHELIRRGPYRIVRHPIYSGVLLALLGTAIVFGRLRGFLGVAIAFGALWMKLQMEEQFMAEQFGEQYALYKSEVKALVPAIL